ncbi:MAG: pectinesterase family protein [Tannerellaceae bacterium]|nr:pectinesterase family protein [Tannerellaceae bacterium]
MIGDSTMADKKTDGGNPERGWGHMWPSFFTAKIKIENNAQNGRSSKSFIEEGRWQKVVDRIQPGDFLFIQFGHNDSKPDTERYTDPHTTYKANLHRFIKEAKEKGGIPVLFTSIVRRNFNENGLLIDTHGDYLSAAKAVAQEADIVLIDLNERTHAWIQALGPEQSKAMFMWVEPGTLPCCPEGKKDDTHLNIAGARQVALFALEELVKYYPKLAPFITHYDFVVAQDGSGDFFTIQEAINAVPDFRKSGRTTIRIRTGIYKEKLIVPECKINVTLIGEEGTVLTYDDYASKLNRFGEEKSTSGSAGCYIYAPDFIAENITFQNTSGPVGQAVAILVKGDRAAFRHCRFLGFQDTLYTYGTGRQYYEECYIEGSVDFIFGGATAVFNHCVIHSLANGYITAPSTPEGKKHGYVFLDCRLTAAQGVKKVYLSRPWRPFAKAVFIHCELDSHIVPEGWHNWNKPEAEKTIFYAEFKNSGKGADYSRRVRFSKQLKHIKGYSVSEILGGEDGWNPLADSIFAGKKN